MATMTDPIVPDDATVERVARALYKKWCTSGITTTNVTWDDLLADPDHIGGGGTYGIALNVWRDWARDVIAAIANQSPDAVDGP